MNCNFRLQFMDELSAPRYIMPMTVSISQHSDKQQFRNTVMCTLRNFLSGKVRFMYIRALLLDHILA